MAMAAIFIVIVVVINMIVGAIPSKYSQLDVSSSKLYTIGDETKKVLKALDKDVTIYQIAPSGSEDDTISNLLSRYKDESKHIKVEVKDQQCSVEIHLHCPGLPENVKCNNLWIYTKGWPDQRNSSGYLRDRKRNCRMPDHNRCNRYE